MNMREGTIEVRVRYCECDPMGVVHHAAYLPWLEMGRTELLRSNGMRYRDLEAKGVFLVLVDVSCRYRRSARYDDVLTIRTRSVGPSSRVKLHHEYEVRRPDDDELLVAARTTIACVDRSGRPAPLPDSLAVRDA